jgi:hypothetical protein
MMRRAVVGAGHVHTKTVGWVSLKRLGSGSCNVDSKPLTLTSAAREQMKTTRAENVNNKLQR